MVSSLLLLGTIAVPGAVISLKGPDTFGMSSLNGPGNWDNGLAPIRTNDYSTGTYFLRTPPNSSSYTFGGGSLCVEAGGRFLLKGSGGQTVTVDNLVLKGGVTDFANTSADYYTETLA
ncbi:MAG TPA: hypothetical protein VF607_16440, partial [Verrucomicrobiae bacterium]